MGIEQDHQPQQICGFDLSCITDLERLLESQEIMMGKTSREVADTLSALSELYWSSGSSAELAESCLLRALDIKTELYGITHQEIIYLLDKLTDRYRQQGRHVEASRLDRWRRQAYQQMVENTGSNPILPQEAVPASNLQQSPGAPAAAAKEQPQPSPLQDAGAPPLCHSQEMPVVSGPEPQTASARCSAAEKTSPDKEVEPDTVRFTQPIPRVILSPIITEKKRPVRLVLESTEERFELGTDSLFIGTAPINDICIRNDSASEKFQALVKREGQDYFVANRATNSPTLLNGYAIAKQTKIGAGDMIKCGNTYIRVE